MCIPARESKYDRVKKFELAIKQKETTIWPDHWQEVKDVEIEALRAKLDSILAGTEQMHRGFLPLWRKAQDHPFYREKRVYSKWEAWIDLLLEVQHKPEPKEVIIKMHKLSLQDV